MYNQPVIDISSTTIHTMFRQQHDADPTLSLPNTVNNQGCDGSDASALPTVPGPGPGLDQAAYYPKLERPSGLPPLPSFSSFARGQHDLLPSRPRMRRRDAQPSSHKQKSAAQPPSIQNATPTSAHIEPLGSSFLQVQPPKSQKQWPRPRQRPFPLQDADATEMPSPSPPPLPSSPTSAPSLTNVAESFKDIEQLADNFSRHGLDLTSRHSGCRSAKYLSPVSESGHSFRQFNYNMSDLRLRAGGNAPVSDLEVDFGGNAPVSDLKLSNLCAAQEPQGVLSATQEVQPSCSPSSSFGPGSLASRNLERMRKSRMALATSRHHLLVHQTTSTPEELSALSELYTQRPPTPTPSVAVTPVPTAAALLLPCTRNTLAREEPRPQLCTSQPPALPTDLPLSPESLALPHHVPIQDDVPLSSYDMRSWLESSSTVEVPPSLVAGTLGANNMTSIYFTAMPEARLPWRKHNGTHQQRSSPLKRVHTPHQPISSYLEQGDPVDLADGPNPPVIDLEVDMTGNEVDGGIYDSDAAMIPDSPIALEAARRDLSPSDSSTDGTLRSVLAAYWELKNSRSDGSADGRHVPLSQRIHMCHMEVEREMMLRQAGYLSEVPAVDEAPLPDIGGYMDVEMRDPLILGLPSGGPGVMGGSWLEHPLSQKKGNRDSQQEGVRKYMGPLRYRLSSEVAMRCANLVHSKPRMRRRRLDTTSKAATSAGSVASVASVESVDSVGSVGSMCSMSADDESVQDSVEVEGIQSTQATYRKGKDNEVSSRHDRRQQSSARDRKHRVSRRRELARQSSRSLLTQAQAHIQARYEAGAQAFAENGLQQSHAPTGQLQLPLPALRRDESHIDGVPSTT